MGIANETTVAATIGTLSSGVGVVKVAVSASLMSMQDESVSKRKRSYINHGEGCNAMHVIGVCHVDKNRCNKNGLTQILPACQLSGTEKETAVNAPASHLPKDG